MKKFFLFACVAFAVSMFAACGSAANSGENADSTVIVEESIAIVDSVACDSAACDSTCATKAGCTAVADSCCKAK